MHLKMEKMIRMIGRTVPAELEGRANSQLETLAQLVCASMKAVPIRCSVPDIRGATR